MQVANAQSVPFTKRGKQPVNPCEIFLTFQDFQPVSVLKPADTAPRATAGGNGMLGQYQNDSVHGRTSISCDQALLCCSRISM
ncbi:hypothetical protein J2W42_006170 [Rhizobium tibeticum]|uniref:Uncharacterized protein n=1 Tax=Rhizobium tibeticum TaxID=501024 RepID=A0A1H8SWR8_9HYPH|nr:hypothetical protein [Rhizobium tibeticum]SEI13520.1 hypothetical protein RTCCBAU85039_4951 [Rhizobium tibeticum]SEO82975.1 hypothetical protein SAMN05216228_102663 [Rhizobium tibeticum]